MFSFLNTLMVEDAKMMLMMEFQECKYFHFGPVQVARGVPSIWGLSILPRLLPSLFPFSHKRWGDFRFSHYLFSLVLLYKTTSLSQRLAFSYLTLRVFSHLYFDHKKCVSCVNVPNRIERVVRKVASRALKGSAQSLSRSLTK